MAELTTIARPYAEAAFRLARDGNALPVWSEMLRLVSAVVAEPKVATALDNPSLAARDKQALLLSLCGDRLNVEGRNFVHVLVEADRVALMPQILEMFGTLKDEADGVVRARIDSAFALSDAQLAALTAALAKRFGKRIEATVTVDPALIGGARITVGDTVIDGTVQAKLATMAQQLRT
jgi:F-type H+-transporting ATPase subunit delta